jgi:hypothetical protein
MCDGTPTPSGCSVLIPNGANVGDDPPDLIVDTCLKVGSGQHVYGYVNVIDGGTLHFEDDGGSIDFRANSVLVQQGGRVKAGSWCCPFGVHGGKLDIGLWGNDPTDQGTITTPTPAGIGCVDSTGLPAHCFPHRPTATPYYCTVPNSDDPCSSTTPTPEVDNNALFEGHVDHGAGGLPFDAGAAFGYKVLAVGYGGSLELFGAKGVAPQYRTDPSVRQTTCEVPTPEAQHDHEAWAALSGESWARLNATALAGSGNVVLDRSVAWEPDDEVVITTTDWHTSHTEVRRINNNDGNGQLTLNGNLFFDHYGEVYDVRDDVPDPPNPNHTVDVRAAVGLLSRDIRVYSLGEQWNEPFPAAAECGYQVNDGKVTTPGSCYFGGHVIARQGFSKFQVQGVEFDKLGQGGRLAHYPVHFHLAKSTAYTNAFITDSSIHESMTRFVTLHGTHDVTVARNVGYLSTGHGYYIEDGSEIDNLLCHNLAASVQSSLVEYFLAQDPMSPTFRFSPPILPSVESGPPPGSDAYSPVAFWTMNMWNELVGNKAVGVGGFGSCYWLLGSSVSGPSQSLHWSTSRSSPQGYAGFNKASGAQAPVKRFRGNSCSTSQYALQTTLRVQPPPPPPPLDNSTYGYTPAANPYAITSDMLPIVGGDYYPVMIGGDLCATSRPAGQDAGENAASCVMTLIDRFTTSFNWAPANFGAVWLRPQFYAFINGAITDQLFGGLTFVSGGSWNQAPPGYFTITKDSVYVGTTQPDTMADAGRAGPRFDIANCGTAACPLPEDGTSLFTGGFQPKRLINIYDGPFFAEGNVFTNLPAFECDPTKVTDGMPDCGIYMSTIQPQSCDGLPNVPSASMSGGMCVMNAAVGWKQPNGFYYPPAFAFESTAFGSDTIRHNVVDQYSAYVQGTLGNPPQPIHYTPLLVYDGITPIDSSTILNDFDGTFTETCWGTDCSSVAPPAAQRRTSSVSANHFFDAPSQTPECQSYGVQTAPAKFLTTVVAPLTADGTAVDSGAWNATFPAVPIYRQRLLSSETPCSGPICNGAAWSCDSATFMMGGQNGQAPYLTADGGLYYIDTDAGGQGVDCIAGQSTCTSGCVEPATFNPGSSYVLYQLFAKESTQVTYQIYVGAGAMGQWVWVKPHLVPSGANPTVAPCSPTPTSSSATPMVPSPTPTPSSATPSSPTPTQTPGGSLRAAANDMLVEPITDQSLIDALNQNVTENDGILEITFDSNLIADQFAFTSRDCNEQCLPRNVCQVSSDGSRCELASTFTEPGLTEAVSEICAKWVTRVGGSTADSDGLSLSDCPASGCLGYRFDLPASWAAKSYADVGLPLATCFPDDATWNRPLALTTPAAGVCPMPPVPAGFCAGPTPTPTAGME